MALYELAVMGSPSVPQIAELERCISEITNTFQLRLGHEIGWSVQPVHFVVNQKTPSAVVFFGEEGVPTPNLDAILGNGIPILPIASAEGRISVEIPDRLKALNAMTYAGHGAGRISTALLECVGLLPRQRRVFVSYRRDDAREAALQLFNALSSRVFDVFLDTHGIAPAEDFQAVLWHRLCDSDVLIMLDTPGYFESRWTKAEFGRALAKGISVLRVGWPGLNPSPHAATASRVDLSSDEIDIATGRLSENAISRICTHLEVVRGQSHAVRSLSLFRNLQIAIESIGGTVTGVGLHNAVYLTLLDGTEIVAYPTVGVPTSVTLNDAIVNGSGRSIAVVFDHIGLHRKWLEHLEWLGVNIPAARWIKASEAAWSFAGWGTP
jgi:hypothetical protein